MKIIDRLTQRLDHMVPDFARRSRNPKEIEAYLEALSREEQAIRRKAKKTK
ncbi:MAG: hypothetical protein AB7N80_06780 [Bdellovibrionales bacterium]